MNGKRSFIKKQQNSQITLDVELKPLDAKELEKYILVLINNLNLEEFELLSQAVVKPFVKAQALKALKKHV